MKPAFLDCVVLSLAIAAMVCAGWVVTQAIYTHFVDVVEPVLGHALNRNLVL